MSSIQSCTAQPLILFGARAAVAGGGLRALATFIPYQPGSAVLEALYGVIDASLLFGLIAVYLATAATTGRVGLAAFALALLGIASILGPDASAFGVDFYQAGSLAILLGLGGLAAGLLGDPQLRPTAMAWLLALALAILGVASSIPLLIQSAGLALGTGFLLAGIVLIRSRS